MTGEQFKIIRKKHRYSQEALAKELGVSKMTIHRIEKDKEKEVSRVMTLALQAIVSY